MPKDEDKNVLHTDGDDGRHVVFHNHVTHENHSQAARSDESSCSDDDVYNDIDLDVTGSDICIDG